MASDPFRPHTAAMLVDWLPYLGRGFLLNVVIAAFAIAAASLAGVALGIALTSAPAPLRRAARLHVGLFRNAPYLVAVFFTTYIFPFEIDLGGHILPFPDWLKAALGLALPASAHMAELVRGALDSLPRSQWDAAASLAFSRIQTLRWVILPQSVRRIIPPWTNLCSSVIMSTVLASLVGVQDLLHTANDASTAVQRTDFTVAVYLLVLLWFFVCCYPLSLLTRHLERRLVRP
jgi:polar amino acid transport system permease protein